MNNRTHQATNKPFFKETKGILRKEEVPVETLPEFMLVLMKNNGHTDFIPNVPAGEFYMKTADGKQEKSILLTPNKLTTLNYNGNYIKGWVAHEGNMTPYPQDPLHNGEMFRKTTQKIAMNYRDANEAKLLEASTKRTVTLVIIGLIVVYVLYTIGKGAGWFGGTGTEAQETQAVANATKQVIQNTTGS